MAVDLTIRGATIVGSQGLLEAGVAVDEGRIVAIGEFGQLPPGRRTIEATGKYLLPGLFDPHVHPNNFRSLADNCRSETEAAAAGGVTTIGLHLPVGKAPGILHDALEAREAFASNAVVDGVFHVQIKDEQSFEELPRCVELGITSFKVTYGDTPTDDGTLFRALEAVAQLGPKVRKIVHCENFAVASLLRERLIRAGRTDFAAWNDSRPRFCEAEAMARMIYLSKVTGCPVYVEHITIAEGVDILSQAKAEGVDVIGETCTQYLTHNSQYQGNLSQRPPLGRVNPPLRDEECNQRLWQGIQTGVIDCIGGDHSPRRMAGKGKVIWEAYSGLGNITETILPVMLSEGVNKGRISLEKLVEICCANPAKAFGLYPRKGAITIGSDADLVVVDLGKKAKVSPQMLHSWCDWSIYDGWELTGWPVLTLVRGQVIAENGQIVARPGTGKYLDRPYLP